MADEISIQLDPLTQTGLTTVQALLYASGSLSATVALSERPASSGRYSNAGAISLAEGVYSVSITDSATGELYGAAGDEFHWNGSAEATLHSLIGTPDVSLADDLDGIYEAADEAREGNTAIQDLIGTPSVDLATDVAAIEGQTITAEEVDDSRTWVMSKRGLGHKAQPIVTVTNGFNGPLQLDLTEALNPNTIVQSVVSIASDLAATLDNERLSGDRMRVLFDASALEAGTHTITVRVQTTTTPSLPILCTLIVE